MPAEVPPFLVALVLLNIVNLLGAVYVAIENGRSVKEKARVWLTLLAICSILVGVFVLVTELFLD